MRLRGPLSHEANLGREEQDSKKSVSLAQMGDRSRALVLLRVFHSLAQARPNSEAVLSPCESALSGYPQIGIIVCTSSGVPHDVPLNC